MMSHYTQLSFTERQVIAKLKQWNTSIRTIAKRIGRSPSTISREIKRNRTFQKRRYHYLPEKAQKKANLKRHHSRKKRIKFHQISSIEKKLALYWSPEQMTRYAKCIGIKVSHTWIYLYIQRQAFNGRDFTIYLRHHMKRKAYIKRMNQQRNKQPFSIENRPEEANLRQRIGDWEIDTIIGTKGSKGAIISLLERTTRFYIT